MRNSQHPLYSTWKSVKTRCNNPNFFAYHRYGGRGIKLYPQWAKSCAGRSSGSGFKAFAAWIDENLGPRPEKATLDRIDNDGHYEPGNLRWGTKGQQAQNREAGELAWTSPRNNRWIAQFTLDGVYHYLGTFATQEEAHEAAKATRKRLTSSSSSWQS